MGKRKVENLDLEKDLQEFIKYLYLSKYLTNLDKSMKEIVEDYLKDLI